jgi:antitoxin VapB
MTAYTVKTFRNGNSEAIRLPKEVAFGSGVELTLVKSGDVVTIYPKRRSMAELVARLDKLPKPSYVEVRDTEEIPEPPGL